MANFIASGAPMGWQPTIGAYVSGLKGGRVMRGIIREHRDRKGQPATYQRNGHVGCYVDLIDKDGKSIGGQPVSLNELCPIEVDGQRKAQGYGSSSGGIAGKAREVRAMQTWGELTGDPDLLVKAGERAARSGLSVAEELAHLKGVAIPDLSDPVCRPMTVAGLNALLEKADAFRGWLQELPDALIAKAGPEGAGPVERWITSLGFTGVKVTKAGVRLFVNGSEAGLMTPEWVRSFMGAISLLHRADEPVKRGTALGFLDR